MLNESKWSDSQLHIFGKSKESVKLLKEFLGRYLCITFGHTHIGMPQHLAYRFYQYSLFKGDERGKSFRPPICVSKIQKADYQHFEKVVKIAYLRRAGCRLQISQAESPKTNK